MMFTLQGAQSAIRNLQSNARRCGNPPQSASRNPPCRKHNIASSVRILNCEGPGTTQHSSNVAKSRTRLR
eukprot:7375953-Alexandrium_andersonii.AAC.1